MNESFDNEIRELHRRYVEEELSTYELERECNYTQNVIVREFHRLGLPLRPRGWNKKKKAAKEIKKSTSVEAPRGIVMNAAKRSGKRRRGGYRV